ncbi:MAG: TRAP transporter substrate-binding protein DctP [Nitrospinota bacterium]
MTSSEKGARSAPLLSLPLALLLLLPAAAHGARFRVKFATLAPEGSTWMKVMRALEEDLKRATGGGLRFRIYPGGVAGNESDVLRKMRLGQIHAAGFTGVGLGKVLPEVRIFELPFLFRDYAEVDRVHRELEGHVERAFESKGYVLLGWAEVGFVHLFSQKPLRSRADLRGTKMWMWQGDPVAAATFKALGASPIPLPVTEVLTSLQTGLVNTVYTSPLGAIALQWFTRTKFMSSFPLANGTGAVLMDKRRFDALPPEFGAVLRERARARLAELLKLTRRDNERAVAVLRGRGIRIVRPPDEREAEALAQVGRRAQQKLAGRLFPKELLERVRAILREHRRASAR